ncbi:MAG: hypothetical protein AAF599_00065 [Bacteroidota bacterium]
MSRQGIIITAVVLVVLSVGGVGFAYWRKKKKQDDSESKDSNENNATGNTGSTSTGATVPTGSDGSEGSGGQGETGEIEVEQQSDSGPLPNTILLDSGVLVMGTLEKGIRVPKVLQSKELLESIPVEEYNADMLYYPPKLNSDGLNLYVPLNQHKTFRR